MKKLLVSLLVLLLGVSLFAKDVEVTITITGLKPNGGDLFINIQNEEAFEKEEFYSTHSNIIDVKNATEILTVILPEDYYYIAVFQDTNGNEELDTKIFGIPKEPVGISNYSGGIPGGFDKHKALLNQDNKKITIEVRKI